MDKVMDHVLRTGPEGPLTEGATLLLETGQGILPGGCFPQEDLDIDGCFPEVDGCFPEDLDIDGCFPEVDGCFPEDLEPEVPFCGTPYDGLGCEPAFDEVDIVEL